MWRSKKFVLILALAIVALVGGTTGAVMASTDGVEEPQDESRQEALLDRVCEIYEENTGVAIDPDQLQGAFDQARDEMREQALADRLQELVDEGEITQEEADQYLEWWQSKPDIDVPGLMGGDMGRGFGGDMMGGRGHHHWGGSPSGDDTSGDISEETIA